jgi:hypothetical protein
VDDLPVSGIPADQQYLAGVAHGPIVEDEMGRKGIPGMKKPDWPLATSSPQRNPSLSL